MAQPSSVNLQHACSDVVFVDVPINGNTIFQAIGRLYRIGQTVAIRAWILALDHTYDQVLQSRCATKMVTNITGTSEHEPTEADKAELLVSMGENAGSRDLSEAELNCNRDAKSVALYMKCLGQATPRHEWSDAWDLTAKDRLPSQGGGVDTLSTLIKPNPSLKQGKCLI